MEHPPLNVTHDNQFVIDLLTTLREDNYSLVAWQRFLIRSWHRSFETANKLPLLSRSWKRITIIMGVFTLCLCTLTGIFEGVGITFRLLPGLLFCVVYQQSDLFWHLGLNRNTRTGQIYERVGLANILTGIRGLCASYLLGRLVGGLHTPSWLALSLFVVGIITDILDGPVARFTGTQSKLGQIADGEADFCLYGAMSLLLIQNALLPTWLGIIMIARFVLPLVGAMVSYFLFAHPLRFGSTRWGKFAGLSQCLFFLVLLAPVQLAPLTHLIAFPLLMITLVLLVIAPIAQVKVNVVA